MALTNPQINQIKNYMKQTISKSELYDHIYNNFFGVIDRMASINDFSIEYLRDTLFMLQSGCQQMTDYYCRTLWTKANEYGQFTIEEKCEACFLHDYCIQNPNNQINTKMYFNICKFWEKLIEIDEKGLVTQDDIDELEIYKTDLNNTLSDKNVFSTLVDGWS